MLSNKVMQERDSVNFKSIIQNLSLLDGDFQGTIIVDLI